MRKPCEKRRPSKPAAWRRRWTSSFSAYLALIADPTADLAAVGELLDPQMRVIEHPNLFSPAEIVATLSDEDMARLVRVRWCPVQFQAFIDGTHVRVHTIGEVALATAIESDATDYRYARQQGGGEPRLRALDLSDELAERCVGLSRALGLDFAGIDLKVTPDGEVFCFEVNPSPAFSYYEQSTGQPIARAVAAHLAGRG